MRFVLALSVVVLFAMPVIAAPPCPGGKCPVPSMVAPAVPVYAIVAPKAPIAKAVKAPRRVVAVAKRPVRRIGKLLKRKPGRRILGRLRCR